MSAPASLPAQRRPEKAHYRAVHPEHLDVEVLSTPVLGDQVGVRRPDSGGAGEAGYRRRIDLRAPSPRIESDDVVAPHAHLDGAPPGHKTRSARLKVDQDIHDERPAVGRVLVGIGDRWTDVARI